jgi:O-6-methylguanine DNA methyltransferase
MNYSILKTPQREFIGVAYSEKGISAVVLPRKNQMEVQLELTNVLPDEFLVQKKAPENLAQKFDAYFRSKKIDFSKLGLDVKGTYFEQKVWKACQEIPHGEVRSYSWIAKQIGKASASRAVGNALNKNPVPIVVPCHRVISTSGIGGFASGLKMKRMLLELENR